MVAHPIAQNFLPFYKGNYYNLLQNSHSNLTSFSRNLGVLVQHFLSLHYLSFLIYSDAHGQHNFAVALHLHRLVKKQCLFKRPVSDWQPLPFVRFIQQFQKLESSEFKAEVLETTQSRTPIWVLLPSHRCSFLILEAIQNQNQSRIRSSLGQDFSEEKQNLSV